MAVLARLVAAGALPCWRVDAISGQTTFAPWPALPAADGHGTIEDRHLAVGGVVAAALTRVPVAEVDRVALRWVDVEIGPDPPFGGFILSTAEGPRGIILRMKQPAQVVLDAPQDLVKRLAPQGYHVAIVITRTGKLDLPGGDVGAFAPPVDKPFMDGELRNIRGAIASLAVK